MQWLPEEEKQQRIVEGNSGNGNGNGRQSLSVSAGEAREDDNAYKKQKPFQKISVYC